ncbi:MAG TPA: 4Fe-4S dicluster domain-containing protein [Syntrophorhabdaceae bacterium]|nr:4Fe-4S dicluster domain-containing protein [Syntrophorhabdaceae bacterium]
MTRWGMVINLNKCIGCYACMIACKQEHYLPSQVFWGRVLVGETGKYPTVRKQVYPVLCNHCQDAACVNVCPTGASIKREDGIVIIDYDKCVGCRYCVMACPYQQRTFYGDDGKEYFPGQGFTEWEIIGRKLNPLQKGTVVKCTFCAERVDEGIKRGLKPGVDRDATPACVNACPAKARFFGDLDDPESEVSKLAKRGSQLSPEHGTNPSVYYIIR